jgi:hypothetical protein
MAAIAADQDSLLFCPGSSYSTDIEFPCRKTDDSLRNSPQRRRPFDSGAEQARLETKRGRALKQSIFSVGLRKVGTMHPVRVELDCYRKGIPRGGLWWHISYGRRLKGQSASALERKLHWRRGWSSRLTSFPSSLLGYWSTAARMALDAIYSISRAVAGPERFRSTTLSLKVFHRD